LGRSQSLEAENASIVAGQTEGVLAMVRIYILVLTLLAGFDHYAYDGKYTSAAKRASTTILYNFGVI
jgi:hypothetical protein